MKVLVVCSGNAPEGEFCFEIHQAFINEQVQEIRKMGVENDIFLIVGKGLIGYLKNLKKLRNILKLGKYDLVHAHFVYSGLLSILQFSTPVIVTFHGGDNVPKLNIISTIVSLICKWRIFVSKKLYSKLYIKPQKNFSIIPCGIDLKLFFPMDKKSARNVLGLEINDKYILFASSFDEPVKNYPLAQKTICNFKNVNLIELKNKTRQEVNLLLNACDLLLLTSISEGSPQVIKEAMACNCPIVSTDVGDVGEIIKDTDGCYLASFDPADVAEKIKSVLARNQRTNGREKIGHLETDKIALKVLNIYRRICGPAQV